MNGGTIALFLLCLVMASAGGAVLAHRIDQIGTHLRLPQALLGLVTALAADSPEIATAISAVVAGHNDLGAGVIFGSNIFNLAVLFGLSVLLAGSIVCTRHTVLLEAGVALWVTAALAVQLLTGAPPLLGGLLLAIVLVPYVAFTAMRPGHVRALPLPGPIRDWLHTIAQGGAVDVDTEQHPSAPSWADWLSVLPLLGCVVGASYGLVETATILGSAWGISHTVLGTLVLAALTGIPNAIAAVQLAAAGRGAAVVSETFNSNSLNLLAGAYMPTLFAAAQPVGGFGRMALAVLLAMTVLSTALLLRRGRLSRGEGLVLLACYAAFVAVVIVW